MKKKLKITEAQLERLKQTILEGSAQGIMVQKMREELDMNYAPIEKFVREGGEYFEKPMIMIKADGEAITPKALYEYMKSKYNVGDEFTKQVIRDWMYGNISDDHGLSKSVAMD